MVDHLLRRLGGLVHMLTKVVRRAKFEQIGVERWHLRLDVVEQISLLHVTSVDLDWHLLEKLTNYEFVLYDILLQKLHFDVAKFGGEGLC